VTEAVKGIVLDMDSGGGMVAGCFDFVDWMWQAKQAAGKPLASILTESAYSACYAIASNTDSIAVPRTGGCGSIGVVMLHVDYSKYAGRDRHHADLHRQRRTQGRWQRLRTAARCCEGAVQGRVRFLAQVFAETVARGRGIDVKTILATEARCYDGPDQLQEALRLGLADAIVAPDQAFAAFQQAVAGA
jgi:ClpP class serine protease